MLKKDCVYRSTFSESNPFWEIWFEHQARLRSCCLRWLNGNQAQVEDALALTVEKALNYYLKRGDDIRSPFSWLCKVAHNTCIDMHRENKKANNLFAQMKDDPSQCQFCECESEELEDQMERQDQLEFLDKALKDMKREHRLAVQLRFIDEMEYSEIAAFLETTPENIRKRIQLARQKLRLIAV